VVHKLWPAASHQLAALFNYLVLLPNYLSECKALQLLRYNTTLNAFGKSKFHLVGYSYTIQEHSKPNLIYVWGSSSIVTAGRGRGGREAYAPGRQQRGGTERRVQ